jgi:hypothetical protein
MNLKNMQEIDGGIISDIDSSLCLNVLRKKNLRQDKSPCPSLYSKRVPPELQIRSFFFFLIRILEVGVQLGSLST